jgi:hypothetical protein
VHAQTRILHELAQEGYTFNKAALERRYWAIAPQRLPPSPAPDILATHTLRPGRSSRRAQMHEANSFR